MRRAYRRMWRVVPCATNKSLQQPESRNIEEILSAKLATIMEEPETCSSSSEEEDSRYNNWRVLDKKRKRKKKKRNENKMGCMFMPRFSLTDSYALIVTGFASKGSFGGLLQY